MKNTEIIKKRRKYKSPKLIEYGSVRDMTRSMTVGSFPDTMTGMLMTMA